MSANRLNMRGGVTVYGPDIMKPPLCDDPSATMVIVKDAGGNPMILLMRFQDGTWGLVTPEDADWEALCVRFGISAPRPMAEIISGSH